MKDVDPLPYTLGKGSSNVNVRLPDIVHLAERILSSSPSPVWWAPHAFCESGSL